MKLNNILKEIQVNKPTSFFQMVENLLKSFGPYITEALLNSHYSNIDGYIEDFGMDEDEIERFQPFYEYFSKIRPNEITSKIKFVVFSDTSKNVFENNSNYKFFEISYYDNDDVIYIFHNYNKSIINK